VSTVPHTATGTPVGDPIECESIRHVFGGGHRSQELFLGSVKDNIGHAEAASGVAGVLKTLLMMQNRTIPKQANFKTLSPKIPALEPDRMQIAKQSQPWKPQKLVAVINNYGAAGNNAAILLAEYPAASEKRPQQNVILARSSEPEYPLFVSAKTPDSLRAYLTSLKLFVAKAQESNDTSILANIAYNLAKKQNRELECSWTSTASSITTLSEQLEATAAKSGDFKNAFDKKQPVVLCFGGQSGLTVSFSEDLFNSSTLLQGHLVSSLLCVVPFASLATQLNNPKLCPR
jgi:acyl transferase domain-containing protein